MQIQMHIEGKVEHIVSRRYLPTLFTQTPRQLTGYEKNLNVRYPLHITNHTVRDLDMPR
jgi:hypothetical protein